MAGSSSIQLKEINVSMAGRANNGNYGHVEPFVALKFEMPADLENWDEAVQQCINVAHDAFIHAAAAMLAGYIGRRDEADMLAELGIVSAVDIVPIEPPTQTVVPLGDDGEYDPDFDDDGYGEDALEDDGDFEDFDDDDFSDEDDIDDTKEVIVPPTGSIGADL